jgi:N4-gp56 family major capsid protein
MGSDWTFATGDAATRKAWAKKFWIEAKTDSYFYGQGLVGTGEDNVIVEMPELEKEQGDQVTVFQLREISGAGVANDGTMEGNEVAPAVYDDAVVLAQVRQAIRTAGRETEMRPSDKAMREWMKDLLSRWMAAQIDQAIFTALETSPTKYIYGGDGTATSDLEAGDYMTLNLIAKCVTYAKKANPMITGPTVKGKRVPGIIVMGPDQSFDLTERDAAWSQSRMQAAVAGNDNPIFTGALGVHKNVPIHEHPRCAISTTWGAGAVNGGLASFLGVQAGTIAYSKKKVWEEKTFDYQNKTGFCIGAIYGFTKNVFNSADNAYIGVATYRTSN